MTAPSKHFHLRHLGSKMFRIFRRNNIFIDEIVLFPCQHKIREYYPIREKHNKFAILVIKLATALTVRLAYITEIHCWFSSWSMLTCTCYFLCCKTPRSPWLLMTRFISLRSYLFCAFNFKVLRFKSHIV